MTTSVSRTPTANAIALALDLVEKAKKRRSRSANGIGECRDGAVARHDEFDASDPHWPIGTGFVCC